MGKKRHHPAEAMSHYRQQFIGGALKGGMIAPKADALWQQIESFAGYAFCKAHSASFARLSYQMAWLKAHHPALFFASILTNQGGFYHPQVYVDEARRGGIHLLPPCVAHGGWETEAVDERTIRIGLQYVLRLSKKTAYSIMAQRPFTSWGDLLARVRPDREAAAMLVQSGATDGLSPSVTSSIRRERLWQAEMELGVDHGSVTPELDLFVEEDDPATVPAPSEPDETTETAIQRELASMDLSLVDHPLRLFRSQLLSRRHDITPARRLSDLAEGQVVTCVGLPVARKSLSTKKGDPMAFLTLSDRTGLIETVLFPKVIRQVGRALRHQAPWIVTGTMKEGCVVVTRAQAGLHPVL